MADKSSIKIRTKTTNGITTVSVMMRHPMETGRRKDPETGEVIPMQHIQQVTCQLNGETVMSAVIGAGISTNPFFPLICRTPKPVTFLNWAGMIISTTVTVSKR